MTVLGALLAAAAFLPGGKNADWLIQGAGQNPCVTCHQQLPAPAAAAHSFAEWQASAHGGVVTCDRCHGGDTTAAEAGQAHQGVFPSREYRSLVHYTRIPATCGACHQQELGFFMESRHFSQIATTRRGPTCVTCHGSMAIRVLAASELDSACGGCHRSGGVAGAEAVGAARERLALLRQADSSLRKLEPLAAQGPPDQRRRNVAAQALDRAREALTQARQGWHAFDAALLDDALRRAGAAIRRADSALAARPGR